MHELMQLYPNSWPFNLYPDFWKSRSWEIKAYLNPRKQQIKVSENDIFLGFENRPGFFTTFILIQSNLAIRNGLIRNKLVLRNHFPWPIANFLHNDKEHLALWNNFRVTKKFLITKFDCTIKRKINSYVFVKFTISEFRNICEKEFV